MPAHHRKVEWPHSTEGINPDDTLAQDLQPPEPWENSFLLVSSQLVIHCYSSPRNLIKRGLANLLI